MQQHMRDLVRQRRPDVPAVAPEAVVELDEVLRPRGQFDRRRVLHLAEPDDHPGVRQMQVLDQRAGHPLGAQMEVVVVGEGDVGGQDARRVPLDPVVRKPPVQRGDRRPYGVDVRKPMDDRTGHTAGSGPGRALVGHAVTPVGR
ncbi:hypothetical protein A8W25_17525 [Streptomyces sp. ERV7]|nr:hypothetical protein A8W25_17525 [Streptomyces sp. ERV7]